MRDLFKKGITFALAFTLVVTMCFGSIGTAKVYATDDRHALSVYDGDTLVKEYSLAELKAIAAEEGNIEYKFSGYNRNPSFAIYTGEKGPSIEGILADAKVDVSDNDLIKFVATDQADATFIADELFRERYFYPNGSKGTANGAKAPIEAYADAEVAPAILAYVNDGDWIDLTLRFGQIAPNEQNRATSMQCMNGGKIIVRSGKAETWEPIKSANYGSGEILPETELTFVLPESLKNKKVQVYYTNDGSEPGFGDAIYNYDRWGSLQKIILPEDEGTVAYKFKVIGYGKLDSETTTFTYTVIDDRDIEVATPENFSATVGGRDSVKLIWAPIEDADGYEVLRENSETGKMEMCIDVPSRDISVADDSALTAGTEYTYQVRAYKKLSSGQKVYGSASVKQTVMNPDLTAPVLSSAVKTGYAGIQLKWEMATGVNGYEIYRQDSTDGSYNLIKRIEGGSTVSYKDTGLKTGNKYSYMIRAYLELADGTEIYGDPSDVKSVTPSLAKPSLNSVVKTGYAGIQVKWSKVAGANGYQVWRYDAVSKKYTLVKTIKNGSTVSWKNTGLKTGRKYTYKVRAYRTVDGKNVFSAYSGTKAATPSLAKPEIAKLTPGSKNITVKWKKVAGANGYKIYRSTAKNGKYTCVKTIKKGGTLSWKNTGLKKGKTYYYKVKAYRIVDKKYVYSSISSSKYTKSK